MAIDIATNQRITTLEHIVSGDLRDISVGYGSLINYNITYNSSTSSYLMTMADGSTVTDIGGFFPVNDGTTFALLGQTNTAQNGIYVVYIATSTGVTLQIRRLRAFTNSSQINNARIQIAYGTNKDKFYLTTTETTLFILDTTSISVRPTRSIFNYLFSTTQLVNTAGTTIIQFWQTFIEGDATAGNIIIRLPENLNSTGERIEVKRLDNTANTITIQAFPGDKLEGVINGTISLVNQYDSIIIKSDGVQAYIIANKSSTSAPSWGSITGTLSSQTDLQNALNLKANLSSPTFTGTPTAPTAALGTNTTQIATTAFVLANAATPALTSGNIFVGNASNIATSVAMSGDATINNTGAITVANNAITNAKVAQMSANTIKGNNTGSTANANDLSIAQVIAMLGATATPTASAIAEWDANINFTANNLINGYTSTATAGTTTTLTVTSTGIQVFTGTLSQTVNLPSVTTLVLGYSFEIKNYSTGILTVQTFGANIIQAMAPNTALKITCLYVATNLGATDWCWEYTSLDGALPLSSSLTSANIFVGNASNVATGVAVTGDISLNNVGVMRVASSALGNGLTGGSGTVISVLPDTITTNMASLSVSANGAGILTDGLSVVYAGGVLSASLIDGGSF